jgi:hypothetical protein
VFLKVIALRFGVISLLTHKIVGYRYFFGLNNTRCVNGANRVIATVGRSRHVLPCRWTLLRIAKRVWPHHRYRITIQAVRMRKHIIRKRGPSYSGRLYMPGSEAQWQPISQPPASF